MNAVNFDRPSVGSRRAIRDPEPTSLARGHRLSRPGFGADLLIPSEEMGREQKHRNEPITGLLSREFRRFRRWFVKRSARRARSGDGECILLKKRGPVAGSVMGESSRASDQCVAARGGSM